MGNQDDRLALGSELVDADQALVLEGLVPHRQNFIDEQNVWVDGGGDGEPQPHLHP